MTKIHIANGRIIDPVNQIDQIGSVYIVDEKIHAVINCPADFTADVNIDASNSIVCPGFIDLSIRLKNRGLAHQGILQSETIAAAHAGVTGLCLFPDTHPIIDTQAVVELMAYEAKKANYNQVYPIAALTQQLAGTELSAMATLKQAGCLAVSNANEPMANLLVLRRAMEYASSYDLLVMYHPEEFSLSNKGCVHEGVFSTKYGLTGIPAISESIAIAQCLELAKLTDCRLHFSQISCKSAMLQIQCAKKYGLNVSADVAIHQLHLTQNDIEPFNSFYHVLPPFRTKEDQQALRQGLADGTIDVLCSDHQPHDIDAKLSAFPETSPGVSSLETLLPLMLSLVKDNVVSLSQGIACMTQNPAKILNIQSGALTVGFNADICIFNAHINWQVNQQNWQSAGQNTPFWNKTLKGHTTYTLQAGKLIYSRQAS